jgi:putative hydrolase of the HAD superfamily
VVRFLEHDMTIRALIFDVNGTLIDIETNETQEDIYRVLANFLNYQGMSIGRGELRDLYFQTIREQLAASRETYPELDIVNVWRDLLTRKGNAASRTLPVEKLKQLPLILAEMHRALARQRLQLFPEVRSVLEQLRPYYRLGIVTDAMSPYALPELRHVGLADFFHPIVISGDAGYRKPDARLFRKALDILGTPAEEAVYIGNDLEQDVVAAKQIGMKTVFFCSGPNQVDPFSTPADYVIYHFAELLRAINHLAQA